MRTLDESCHQTSEPGLDPSSLTEVTPTLLRERQWLQPRLIPTALLLSTKRMLTPQRKVKVKAS